MGALRKVVELSGSACAVMHKSVDSAQIRMGRDQVHGDGMVDGQMVTALTATSGLARYFLTYY